MAGGSSYLLLYSLPLSSGAGALARAGGSGATATETGGPQRGRGLAHAAGVRPNLRQAPHGGGAEARGEGAAGVMMPRHGGSGAAATGTGGPQRGRGLAHVAGVHPHLGRSPREGGRRRGGSAQQAWWRSGAGRARGAMAWRPSIMASTMAGSHAEAEAALLLRRAAHYPSLLSHSFSLSALPASSSSSSSSSSWSRHSHWSLLGTGTSASYGWGAAWEQEVRRSVRPRWDRALFVVVMGAAGFVGSHCSLALRARGDGVLGLDNFNAYYDPSLKRARQRLLASHGGVVLDADINDAALLERLLSVVPFTHVLHLMAQVGGRDAMRAPQAYMASNVAGLVALFEAVARHADPQPAVVWASSSSVYGLNTELPFSEDHCTGRPASLYAATKKAGEAIAHAYSHIYGLSITGLRFFTVYGPWGRSDMAYFSFNRSIIAGEPITLFRTADGVVRGCLSMLDMASKSTGSKSGKKRGPALLRVYSLGKTLPVAVHHQVCIRLFLEAS